MPELLQANSVKGPVHGAVAGDSKAIMGLVRVDPTALAVTVVEEATNSNHIPLLLPAVKQEGGLKVPVMPVLLKALAPEHPLEETWIAVEQSAPVAAKEYCDHKDNNINKNSL